MTVSQFEVRGESAESLPLGGPQVGEFKAERASSHPPNCGLFNFHRPIMVRHEDVQLQISPYLHLGVAFDLAACFGDISDRSFSFEGACREKNSESKSKALGLARFHVVLSSTGISP